MWGGLRSSECWAGKEMGRSFVVSSYLLGLARPLELLVFYRFRDREGR
jgi:hypothetical protein